jgi:hypothetical protein
MLRFWRHMLLLSLESHCVIAMRTVKLASGGISALDEASRILAEKFAATADLPRSLATRSPLILTVGYRKMVRSNLRRLTTNRSRPHLMQDPATGFRGRGRPGSRG